MPPNPEHIGDILPRVLAQLPGAPASDLEASNHAGRVGPGGNADVHLNTLATVDNRERHAMELAVAKSRRRPKPGEVLGINARGLGLLRYPQDGRGQAGRGELAQALYCEIMQGVEKGRVPFDAALDAVRLAECEILDRLLEESFSWATDAMPAWHPGTRGRADSD